MVTLEDNNMHSNEFSLAFRAIALFYCLQENKSGSIEIFCICVLIAPESLNCLVKNVTCNGMRNKKKDVFKLNSYKNKR